MNQSLYNFENWLTANRPEFLSELNGSASTEAISNLRQTFPSGVPDDFCNYLQSHDGQSSVSSTLYDNVRLMPISEILHAVRILNECAQSGEFATDQWWKSTWLPFTADGGGNHIVLDCESGTILEFWKSDSDRPKIASSFSGWLEEIVEMFSSGEWILERGAYIRATESTPADPYEKVSVVLTHLPTGGLSALKPIYDKLSLSYGIGKLAADCKTGPVTLLAGIYYIEACRQLSGLDDTTPLQIRSDENTENVYPVPSA